MRQAHLESQYARDALRQFYKLVHASGIEGCSLEKFETITGLSLTAEEGGLKDELPPIHTFLNRMLALTIAMQNLLFDAFEQLLAARIEGAIAAGVYDKGLETLTADHMTVKNRRLNSAEVYIDCCLAGLGLILIPVYDVLPAFQAAPLPMTLLYTHRQRLTRRVQVFSEWLATF